MMRTETAIRTRSSTTPPSATRRHFHARAAVAARRLAGRASDGAMGAPRAAVAERAPAAVAAATDARPAAAVLATHDRAAVLTDRVGTVHHPRRTAQRPAVIAEHDSRPTTPRPLPRDAKQRPDVNVGVLDHACRQLAPVCQAARTSQILSSSTLSTSEIHNSVATHSLRRALTNTVADVRRPVYRFAPKAAVDSFHNTPQFRQRRIRSFGNQISSDYCTISDEVRSKKLRVFVADAVDVQ